MNVSPGKEANATKIAKRTSFRLSFRFLRAALPSLSLALVILGIAWLNPRAMSYLGLNLMLNLGIPTALATVAQMFVITVNDLDLSIGTFVSFVGCVAATWLRDVPLLGLAVLISGVAVYALIGAVIAWRIWNELPQATRHYIATMEGQMLSPAPTALYSLPANEALSGELSASGSPSSSTFQISNR